MVEIVDLQIKLPVKGTKWISHGDHPSVQRIPDNLQLPNGIDRNICGLLGNNVFGPNTWIIESGGNVFPVDDNYFNDYYSIIES